MSVEILVIERTTIVGFTAKTSDYIMSIMIRVTEVQLLLHRQIFIECT